MKQIFGGVLAVAMLSGCANFNTIARTTEFSPTGDGQSELKPNGRVSAVHLDIQQRLVLANSLGQYCAEASPDALAAYAASFGLGAGAPGQGAGSAAGSGASNAASVGLRSQSITLMRDALYRSCEAFANGAIDEAQMMTLLSRSQDLTAVILAVEQLTGATTANQVSLTNSAEADASANIASSSKLLELAQQDLERRERRLGDAQDELLEARNTRDTADAALKTAQAAKQRIDADGSSTAEARADAATDVRIRTSEFSRASNRVETAANRVESRQRSVDAGQETVDALSAQQEAAITNASAAVSGSSDFSGPSQKIQLDEAATEAVADSVEEMVKAVLSKNYYADYCIAIVRSAQPGDEAAVDLCKQLLTAEIASQASRYGIVQRVNTQTRQGAIGTNLTTCVTKWLDEAPDRFGLLQAWVAKNKNLVGSPGAFIVAPDSVKAKFVRDQPTLSC